MSSLILIGPPGAGKGTQKEKIIEKYNIAPIVPGDLMREEIKNKTDIGLQLIDYVNRGLLAPHEIAMQVVKKKIDEYKSQGVKNILFDGFPREIEQADAIEELLKNPENASFEIKCVLLFNVNDDVVVERIKKRALTSGRADDVDENIIKTRLDIFHKKINDVIKKYKKMNLLYEIEGKMEEEKVFGNINNILQKIL